MGQWQIMAFKGHTVSGSLILMFQYEHSFYASGVSINGTHQILSLPNLSACISVHSVHITLFWWQYNNGGKLQDYSPADQARGTLCKVILWHTSMK